jgi:hypothetical protein
MALAWLQKTSGAWVHHRLAEIFAAPQNKDHLKTDLFTLTHKEKFMELNELLTLILMLSPGLLLSVLVMTVLAAGG